MRLLRLLIVDDEPLVRGGIRNGLSSLTNIEIVGECGPDKEAMASIPAHSPDLVLLDVQMQDFTGLEVVEKLGP